jgi:DNA-binding protein HU-beta
MLDLSAGGDSDAPRLTHHTQEVAVANISRAELVEQVAAQAGTDNRTAASVLKAFEDTVLAHVTKGDRVALTGFVAFEQVAKKAGTARNPQTGETVKVKAKKVPRVSAGATFKKTVNKEAQAPKLAKVVKR